MNSKKTLGAQLPQGKARLIWNALMIFATSIATFGSVWAIKDAKIGEFPAGKIGIAFLATLFIVGTLSFLKKEKQAV